MNPSDPRTLMLAMVNLRPGADEAEFNRWYNEEHAAERMHCPGFISMRRFRATEASPRYLALYELAGLGALQTREYGSLIRIPSDIGRPGVSGSELTKAMVSSFDIVARGVYTEIYQATGQLPELPA